MLEKSVVGEKEIKNNIHHVSCKKVSNKIIVPGFFALIKGDFLFRITVLDHRIYQTVVKCVQRLLKIPTR
jgi:hypothetical protein